jgi:hypothetical protein
MHRADYGKPLVLIAVDHSHSGTIMELVVLQTHPAQLSYKRQRCLFVDAILARITADACAY